MNKLSLSIRRMLIAAIVFVLVGQACTISLFDGPNTSGTSTQTPPLGIASPTPQPVAQTNFVVTLPEALQANETLAIAVMDEVTGLSVSTTLYPMGPRDSLTYTGTLPLPFNSIVKYRYIRRGAAQVFEDTNFNTAIRYRMYYVAGPAEVHDIISDWADRPAPPHAMGSINGQVFNADTGSTLPNLLVSAGGVQFITDSVGRFELNGLPIGTQNLLVYSLDGLYQPFQQGANVGQGTTTTVDVRVKPSQLVNVTFSVTVPSSTVPGVPVRIAGNLLQFGNTFADLQGGLNTSTDRMPIMSLQPDGRYSTTIALPAGTYIQYKYTLGDGFWNAEHKLDGQWFLREFMVPTQDLTIQDTVISWSAGDSSPILFEASVPSVTPPGDIIYIQFNNINYWTEPIPMWPLGNNRWAYKLYGPLNMLGSFTYRYCRNGQCGSTDDIQTVGAAPIGRSAQTSILSQDIQDTISAWKWYENPESVPLVGANITPYNGFVTGVEFQSTYRPNWSYYAPQAFSNIQGLGANNVILTPSWTYTTISPVQFGSVPGQDPLWIDSAIMISQARALGLNVSLFPAPNFPGSSSTFWQGAPRDAQWWQTWFTRYRAFAVNYADLANQTGSQTLILGGEWLTPALPGGKLPDGNPSNAPADVEAQWKSVIAEVRTHFKGQILWALPYTRASIEAPLNFLQDVDGIYLLWSATLSTNPSATKTDFANEAGRLLDNEVFPLKSLLNKPLILAVAYPSATGAATGCISNSSACLDWTALSRPNADIDSVNLSLQTQADIYEALLITVNARSWISGFVSRGYYPPAALQDKSASIHGKPVADILWYWYPRITGAVK